MSLITSILTGGPSSHQTTSEEANAPYTDFASTGVVGALVNTAGVAPSTGGFAVNATGTPDTNIQISAGVIVITGTPSSQNSQKFRIRNTATATLAISSNSSGSTKYDWIYVKLDATNLNAPNTAGDNVATIVASRSSSSSADDGTPPTYGYPIAVVTVANGFSTITNATIRDIRVQSGMTPTPVSLSTNSWTSAGATPSSIVANGNRSYTLTWPTSILSTRSVGMRSKYTRTVTAPIQCTSLNGTTQYYSKTSPSAMTFTDDFVVSAWVKMTAYGTISAIASRYNGTSGWMFRAETDGRISLVGFNTGAANFSQVVSYQSIPLNKWVHVTAQLDMSAFTATTTTSYVMFDGLDVPASVARGGTNPTSLINNVGDLSIAAANATQFFPGKIAQVAIYNAKVTQANIRATISQGLLGTETALISAYSLSGSANDLNTTNANNLTANGAAVVTNADSPFAQGATALYYTAGTTEYSITTLISSDGLTETVQVPEGSAIPTSGGVSAVSYSTQKVPYGLPIDRGKWRINLLWRNENTTASNATFAAFTGMSFTPSIGAWDVGYDIGLYNATTTIVYWNMSATSQTGLTGTASDLTLQVRTQSPAAAVYTSQYYQKTSVNLTTATTYTMYTLGATTAAGILGTTSNCEIFAEFNLI